MMLLLPLMLYMLKQTNSKRCHYLILKSRTRRRILLVLIILDPAVGDLPFVQSHQTAVLAMDCCDMIRQYRHDLASEVWKVLEPLGVSCGLSSFRVVSEGHPDSTLLCPVLQRDGLARHVIAYEAKRQMK